MIWASSDSQAMGRIGEVICRTWQTAHKVKSQRGPLHPDGPDNDNFRIKRYIAKYTINVAILWKPPLSLVLNQKWSLKAGLLPGQWVIMRPMFSAFGKAGSENSVAFVSKAAAHANLKEGYGLKKNAEPVGNVWNLTKLDMKLNDALPSIRVDPETYTVVAEGEALACSAATTFPLSRNYFLF
ncbi:hypothetical protein MLD38_009416 [Melastoma candidum]|uniref:Uncharacterized protein n=1 Tax=Melastoma candidum TaxID=119954 RepID=A0ACB9RY30_9MYRT|nr:hypothetical protein MLD38_009416 [Melastoma candidum]